MVETNNLLNQSLPPAHVDYVRESAVSTLGSICGVDPEVQWEVYSVAADQGIIGIISIVGDITWTVMLGFPRETASALAIKFAGFDIPFESGDMDDVVGELANIVAGDVAARLEVVGLRADLSLPTVARGTDQHVRLPNGVTFTRTWFSLPDGKFWVDLALGRHHGV